MAKEPQKTSEQPAAGPEKVTRANAGRPVVETVETATTPSGEPRSAEIQPELPPIATVENTSADPATLRAAARRADASRAGTLPATARVTADGERVELSAQGEDRTTRDFTATVRILNGRTIYEPGAPVPLTRSEFIAKRDAGAIAERDWSDGRANVAETAQAE